MSGPTNQVGNAFMLMLSSIFVPLFGVVISQLAPGLPAERSVRWAPAALWLLGIATFHAGAQWWPAWGSALPSLALTLGLGTLLRRATLRELPPDGRVI